MKFCIHCGAQCDDNAIICPACGQRNTGKFCPDCGAKKPESAPACSGCDWKPVDPANPPKFCPECGKKFGE